MKRKSRSEPEKTVAHTAGSAGVPPAFRSAGAPVCKHLPIPLLLSVLSVVLLFGRSAGASLLTGIVNGEGIVIATDTRLNRVTADGDHQVVSDNFPKLVVVDRRFLVATTGQSHLDEIPVWRHLKRIEAEIDDDTGLDEFIDILAEKLSVPAEGAEVSEANDAALTVLIAGYENGEGRLVELLVPQKETTLLHTTSKPGMAWSGDATIPSRLIIGSDPAIRKDSRWEALDRRVLGEREFRFALPRLTLQDMVELAVLTVRTAIEWSRLIKDVAKESEVFHPTIGGGIEAAVVTPSGARWVRRHLE